jgi:hypothetical protein
MMQPLSAPGKNQPSRKNIVKERCGIIYDSIAIDLSCRAADTPERPWPEYGRGVCASGCALREG